MEGVEEELPSVSEDREGAAKRLSHLSSPFITHSIG